MLKQQHCEACCLLVVLDKVGKSRFFSLILRCAEDILHFISYLIERITASPQRSPASLSMQQ